MNTIRRNVCRSFNTLAVDRHIEKRLLKVTAVKVNMLENRIKNMYKPLKFKEGVVAGATIEVAFMCSHALSVVGAYLIERFG